MLERRARNFNNINQPLALQPNAFAGIKEKFLPGMNGPLFEARWTTLKRRFPMLLAEASGEFYTRMIPDVKRGILEYCKDAIPMFFTDPFLLSTLDESDADADEVDKEGQARITSDETCTHNNSKDTVDNSGLILASEKQRGEIHASVYY